MRFVLAAASLAALAFAQTASAQSVTLAPVSFAPEFQARVDNDIGADQGDVLRARVQRAIGAALARRGASVVAGAPVTIEVDVVNAVPNRVTVQQLRSRYTLDAGPTVQLGGADLHAVLRGSNGTTLAEVVYRRYDYDFTDIVGPPAMWTSADRTIARFAERVADAYVAQTGAR
ncbi:MAG: hypothetical protein JSS00_15100 [Proteobacteria bacterium]|nr:hypothetical protein [Pseudomonadota bacterium]